MKKTKKRQALLLMGPTGVGKSAMAFKAARNKGAEIVNADSLQIYKGLNIGTSKPNRTQMRTVPHHLYSMIDLGSRCTVGRYYRLARPLLQNSNRPMLVVGGSGFYLQALEKGLPIVKATTLKMQQKVENEAQHGLPLLYKELVARDPVAAKKIHPHDTYRIIRGVALMRSENKSLTQIHSTLNDSMAIKCVKVGLCCDRSWLKTRLEQRLHSMLKQGFVDEVRGLQKLVKAQTLAARWPPLRSVGYKEVWQFLNKQLTREQMLEAILKRSLLLAKKQLTWLKRSQGVQSFFMPDQYEQALECLNTHL